MNLLDLDHLLRYWTLTQWQANVLMLLHLLGAMVLGLVLGYERAYHGRAAGMRTYALVCMASAAVIILLAYPQQWFGGLQAGAVLPPLGRPDAGDPGRGHRHRFPVRRRDHERGHEHQRPDHGRLAVVRLVHRDSGRHGLLFRRHHADPALRQPDDVGAPSWRASCPRTRRLP